MKLISLKKRNGRHRKTFLPRIRIGSCSVSVTGHREYIPIGGMSSIPKTGACIFQSPKIKGISHYSILVSIQCKGPGPATVPNSVLIHDHVTDHALITWLSCTEIVAYHTLIT